MNVDIHLKQISFFTYIFLFNLYYQQRFFLFCLSNLFNQTEVTHRLKKFKFLFK